jgi:fermentation-respiration switch protein FrsA (DUF1100 family)
MKKYNGKKTILAAALLIGTMSFGFAGVHTSYAATPTKVLAQASQMKQSSIRDLDNDTRVFAVDKSIEAKNVRFENRYGFEVAGHLYLPKDFNASKKYKAVVVSGPFGAVKEQSSGLYAQEMAKNGFVAIAFDPSTTGESSGTRRNMGSPEIFTEDYSAAVDFASNLKFVNPDQIGAIGICGLSGMALTAASNDTRIKAVATSAMYDMSESISDHYKGDYYTPAQRALVKQHLAQMRDQEAKTGQSIRGAHELAVDANGQVQTFDTMFPDKLPADTNSVIKEFYNYYVGRAFHPRAINSNKLAWDSTTPYGFFNFKLMENIDEISPRPVLLITGEKAHSKYFADAVYEKLKSPKQEIVVPGATHTDLYDQMDKIPFDKLVAFFNNNLK